MNEEAKSYLRYGAWTGVGVCLAFAAYVIAFLVRNGPSSFNGPNGASVGIFLSFVWCVTFGVIAGAMMMSVVWMAKLIQKQMRR